jgi:hypothetical protein
MVISVEPGIYLRGFGGIRHSDTVLVTKDGHELLTNVPRNLDRMVIQAWRPFTRMRGRFVQRALRIQHSSPPGPELRKR